LPDLEASDRSGDGRWVLEFNYAYSPFCARAERHECPLVPTESWPEVPVEAGSRKQMVFPS
jgi:hypothetical protein